MLCYVMLCIYMYIYSQQDDNLSLPGKWDVYLKWPLNNGEKNDFCIKFGSTLFGKIPNIHKNTNTFSSFWEGKLGWYPQLLVMWVFTRPGTILIRSHTWFLQRCWLKISDRILAAPPAERHCAWKISRGPQHGTRSTPISYIHLVDLVVNVDLQASGCHLARGTNLPNLLPRGWDDKRLQRCWTSKFRAA